MGFRLAHLPAGKELTILDAFHGQGMIWECIKRSRPVEVVGIDTKMTGSMILRGNNVKYLASMDLDRFDVIDLDAYGMPYRQLEAIMRNLKRRKIKRIFYTCVQKKPWMGGINRGLLRKIGYSDTMIEKCPTLFYREGFKKWRIYLGVIGIDHTTWVKSDNKHYGMFDISPDNKAKL